MSLFKLKGWEIRNNENEELHNVKVTGHHLNCSSKNQAEVSWFANEPPTCWNCESKVPDEIQALMYLHEGMDYE